MTQTFEQVRAMIEATGRIKVGIDIDACVAVVLWTLVIRELRHPRTNTARVVLRGIADQLKTGLVGLDAAYAELLVEDTAAVYADACHECEPSVECPRGRRTCQRCGA